MGDLAAFSESSHHRAIVSCEGGRFAGPPPFPCSAPALSAHDPSPRYDRRRRDWGALAERGSQRQPCTVKPFLRPASSERSRWQTILMNVLADGSGTPVAHSARQGEGGCGVGGRQSADAAAGRITELVAPDAFDERTILALFDTVPLRRWTHLDEAATQAEPFRLASGQQIGVAMVNARDLGVGQVPMCGVSPSSAWSRPQAAGSTLTSLSRAA